MRRVANPIVILRHPLHPVRERSDATLRLRRGLRRTTSDKQRNGKWRKYRKARLWRIQLDKPIRSSRIVSDSPVAAWLPPNEKYARVSSTRSDFSSYPFFERMYMAAISATTEQTKQRSMTMGLRYSCLNGRTARYRPAYVRARLRRTATEIKMVLYINCLPPGGTAGSSWFPAGLITPCDTFRHVLQCARSPKRVTTVT